MFVILIISLEKKRKEKYFWTELKSPDAIISAETAKSATSDQDSASLSWLATAH